MDCLSLFLFWFSFGSEILCGFFFSFGNTGGGGGGRELESVCFVCCLLTGIHVASSALSRSLAIAY